MQLQVCKYVHIKFNACISAAQVVDVEDIINNC